MFTLRYRRNLWSGMFRYWATLIPLLLVLGVTTVMAEEVPTTITSKTMTAQSKAKKAIFEGSVVLTQGDLVVHSDVMIVHFKDAGTNQGSPSSQSSNNKIDIIEAKGKVVIEKSTGKATCGHAVYYKDEEKIVLTESPVAWQRGTRVSGPKMTMYLKEDRSIVEGGSQVLFMEEGEGG